MQLRSNEDFKNSVGILLRPKIYDHLLEICIMAARDFIVSCSQSLLYKSLCWYHIVLGMRRNAEEKSQLRPVSCSHLMRPSRIIERLSRIPSSDFNPILMELIRNNQLCTVSPAVCIMFIVYHSGILYVAGMSSNLKIIYRRWKICWAMSRWDCGFNVYCSQSYYFPLKIRLVLAHTHSPLVHLWVKEVSLLMKNW